jgi:hypothetical protein
MGANKAGTVALTTDEITVLSALMGDVQMAVSAFYAQTARSVASDSLGTEVRTFLSATQTLHERLSETLQDRIALSDTNTHVLIDAIRYVRNVSQHVLHVVRPSEEGRVLIGGPDGLRMYVVWDDVPSTAHAALRPKTQQLRSAFETRLCGQDVTSTMLSVLRAFASLVPQIIDRDQFGEWRGFPLQAQPSVPGPVHPEEPDDLEAARAWLDSRPPNGDARLIVGQVTIDGDHCLLGYTIVGRRLINVFIESCHQVEDDIAAGFKYFHGDPTGHCHESEGDPRGGARTGPLLCLSDDINKWAMPLASVERRQDWGVDLVDPGWARIARFARRGYLPDAKRYEVRRAQRLNV